MNKFKIGDKVLINKVFSDNPEAEKAEKLNWAPAMDNYIGEIGEITFACHRYVGMPFAFYSVRTKKDNKNQSWNYHEEALTMHIENPLARINLINKIKERQKQ